MERERGRRADGKGMARDERERFDCTTLGKILEELTAVGTRIVQFPRYGNDLFYLLLL